MKRIVLTILAAIIAVVTLNAKIGDKVEIDGICYEIIEYTEVLPNPPYEYPLTKNLIVARAYEAKNIPADGIVNIPSTISIDGETYEVLELGDSLFEGREDLKELNMSSERCAIQSKVFKDCGDITLNISGVILEVRDEAYSGTNVTNGIDLSKAIIIGGYALRGTKTTKCTFGSWLWLVGIHVFDDSEITDINFIENDCNYDVIVKFCTRTFYQCKIKELRLPQKYIGMPWGMIHSCANLERVIFPVAEKVRPIGPAYNDGSGMEGYPYYPEICKIHNCPNLKEVVCLNEEPLLFKSQSETVTDISILDDYSTCVLKVPAGSEDAYRADPVWGKFKQIEGFQPGEYSGVEATDIDARTNAAATIKLAMGMDWLSQELHMGKVEIYTVSGVKVMETVHGGGLLKVDLPEGIYLVTIK